ncbi:PIN domain-containing protein [Humibacter sp. BT305]|nr:PIN domain-containing protein [Humibacter sp. BT305]
MVLYVDSSALVKLAVDEPETDDLQEWLARHQSVSLSSEIVQTELIRAVRRREPDRVVEARHVLMGVQSVTLTPNIVSRAAWIEPSTVRSLDALHVATAMEVADDIDAFVTYDIRMQECARAHGFDVVAPGA